MLPKSLKYGNKSEASMARSYTSNIQPNGALSGYNQKTVTTIMVPTGPNLALIAAESVLKFAVTTLGAGDGRLDSAGAHGFIQRCRIFHGSNLLEDTDSYGLVAKEYFDLQVSTDAAYGKYSIIAGTRSDQVVAMYNAATVAGTANATNLETSQDLANALKVAMVKGGNSICTNSGAILPAGTETTYCITLLSILGSLCSNNYFPLFECTAAPIRLEIQWADNVQAVGAFPNTTTGFRIDHIEYIASYIALSSEAMSIIKGGQSGPLSFTLQGLRNYNTSANLVGNNATTQINFNIPAKFASVKNIIACIRDTAHGVNIPMYFPFSSNKNGLQSYYFKIGSHSSIPAIAPSTDAQYFTELLKAVGSISDLNHHPSIDIGSYVQALAVGNTAETIATGSVNSGSFMVGLDLENYAESDKSTIYTGYNTKNDDVILSMTFKVAGAEAISARLDAFVMFDQELVFENGTCYVSF
jgi:hypothetical protein